MPDVLSFDYVPEGVGPWVAFENAAQFEQAVIELSDQALNKLRLLDELFPNLDAIAAFLTRKAAAVGKGVALWELFDAAVANGLTGDLVTANRLMDDAREKFAVLLPDLDPMIEPYQTAMSSAAEFRAFVSQRMEDQRVRYAGARGSGAASVSDDSIS